MQPSNISLRTMTALALSIRKSPKGRLLRSINDLAAQNAADAGIAQVILAVLSGFVVIASSK